MAKEATNGGATTLYLKPNTNGRLGRKATDEEKAHYEQQLQLNPTYNGSDIGVARFVSQTTGNVSYQKQYSSTDYGYISRVGIVDANFSTGTVKMFSISIQSEETGNYEVVQFPLLTQKGGLTQMAKYFALIMPKLSVNTKYSLSASRKDDVDSSGKARYSINLYVNYKNEDDSTSFVKSDLTFKSPNNPNGDIPAGVEKTVLGKKTKDYSEQDDYIYKILTTEIARLTAEIDSKGSTAPSVSSKVAPVKSEINNVQTGSFTPPDEISDDLPF